MAEHPKRPLTPDEQMILGFIQQRFGSHNTEERVFFTDNDEAAIFAKDSGGNTVLCAVLTNLAEIFRSEGSTPEQFSREWLATQ